MKDTTTITLTGESMLEVIREYLDKHWTDTVESWRPEFVYGTGANVTVKFSETHRRAI